MKKPLLLLALLLALQTAIILLSYSASDLAVNALFLMWAAIFGWLAVSLREPEVPKRFKYGIAAFLIIYASSLLLFVVDTVTSYD